MAFRRLGGSVVCVTGIVGAVLVGRHVTATSWPLQGAQFELAFGAGIAYLASFVFRALGWQQLFPESTRPDRGRCLAACGAAAASGAVLPFRLDYVVKVATLRRLGGIRLGLETIAFSIVSLGLVDAVAMLPLAVAAFVTSGAIFRAPLAVVMLFCVGCIAVLAVGPRIGTVRLVARSALLQRACRRVGGSAACTSSTFAAAGFLAGCWLMRALGNTLLLWALGIGFSPTFALVILCMAAAASIVPITAGGAVVSIGATSGVLLALGAPARVAVNFSLASGLLLTSTALIAGVAGVSASLVLALNRRRLLHG
ncbi:MAG TPA: hypothetical protein VFB25_05460 [Gaiellaceae bacterium]|nr:hypothetical protein [Gaiellaceae bacterium]